VGIVSSSKITKTIDSRTIFIGVISTYPSFIGGCSTIEEENINKYPVGFIGQLPIKIMIDEQFEAGSGIIHSQNNDGIGKIAKTEKEIKTSIALTLEDSKSIISHDVYDGNIKIVNCLYVPKYEYSQQISIPQIRNQYQTAIKNIHKNINEKTKENTFLYIQNHENTLRDEKKSLTDEVFEKQLKQANKAEKVEKQRKEEVFEEAELKRQAEAESKRLKGEAERKRLEDAESKRLEEEQRQQEEEAERKRLEEAESKRLEEVQRQKEEDDLLMLKRLA